MTYSPAILDLLLSEEILRDLVWVPISYVKLVCSASFLNNDLFESIIVSSPNCACGVPREDAFHLFFECSKYTDIRRDLLIF
jgi:hypothetical protein